MEILLRRSSLRPWLGHAAYGSFAHRTRPREATNIQPSAQLLVHSRGAPLRLLSRRLFVPVWGRRFLLLCMCSNGLVLICTKLDLSGSFESFFYCLGPVCFIYTSVLSSPPCQSIVVCYNTEINTKMLRGRSHCLYWSHTLKQKQLGKNSVLMLVIQHVMLNNFVADVYLTSTGLLSGTNIPRCGMLSDL